MKQGKLFRLFNLKILLIVNFLSFYSVQSQEILEKGRFSGYMFGDYYYNIMRDSSVAQLPFVNYKDAKDLNGFEFRRIYFTYDYQISDQFSSRFRLEADQFTLTSNSKIGVFVKDAYLQWKNIFQGSNLTIGIQPTPTFDISEFSWENRHVEKTIIDLYGFSSSRDFGISLKGKIDKEGIVNYWFLFGNGSGNTPETDRHKTLYSNFFFKPSESINAFINYYHKYQKPISDKFVANQILSKDEDLVSIFFTFHQKDLFKVGVENFYNYVRNSFYDTLQKKYLNRNMLGISLFGIFYLSKKVNFVFRFDQIDPNISRDFQNDKRNLFLFCLNYKPIEKIYLTPSLLIETYEKTKERSFAPSITTRFVFFYLFY